MLNTVKTYVIKNIWKTMSDEGIFQMARIREETH